MGYDQMALIEQAQANLFAIRQELSNRSINPAAEATPKIPKTQLEAK